MPSTEMSQEFKMTTRDRFTTVDVTLSIKVDGRELPNLAVVGAAMESAQEVVEAKIKENYSKVAFRSETPIAEPYPSKT